jgi:predicted dehydrogenase
MSGFNESPTSVRGGQMRVAFIGVSHWHAPLFYRPAARLPGVEIVAMSDPDPALAQAIGRQFGARSFTDYRELIAEARPEFVFAFGPHCDMPEIASTLVEEGVPFVIEKPGGLSAAQVAPVRDRAREKGLYAGTGFNFRVSEMYRRIQEVIGDDQVTHASFRWISGAPSRYHESGCSWMLDPKRSGGGSTINLSGHFVDMFQTFSRSRPTAVTAMLGNSTWGLPIEDYSSMIVRSPKAVCTIETGYTYPGQWGTFDLRFSIRTTRHYLIARDDDVLEVHRSVDGEVQRFPTRTSNFHWYGVFVAESIDRYAKGLPPVASLDDLVGVMEVVDAAYASDRAGGARVSLGDR